MTILQQMMIEEQRCLVPHPQHGGGYDLCQGRFGAGLGGRLVCTKCGQKYLVYLVCDNNHHHYGPLEFKVLLDFHYMDE